MKKTMTSLLFGLSFLLSSGAYAITLGTNITIPDKMYSSATGWEGQQEDQEVEPGSTTNQQWDLEGFFLQDNTLTMVGGYDFVKGLDNTRSGDIFIDVTGDAKYGPANNSTNSPWYDGTVGNSFGYDYVLDLNFSNLTYSVYELTSYSRVKPANVSDNNESNPWRYSKYGDLVEGWSNISFDYLSGLADSDVNGLRGGYHNAASFDLSFLGSGVNFTSHFTMECGNDNLMGKGATTPEPATMMLFGMGLTGLAFLRKRKVQ